MKKELKGFVCGVVLTALLGCGASAAGVWDNISVLKNDIKVIVNGNEVVADNFVYEDTTYLPLRAVSMALGEKVEYYEASNTAYIGERKGDGVLSKYVPPQDLMNRGMLLNDGVYYIMGNTVQEIAYSKDYALELDDETKEVYLSKGVLSSQNDGIELGRWSTVEFNGWFYIPYDTFVDEIEPLLK